MARLTYQIEIRHPGLHEFKIVRGSTRQEAEEKAHLQLAKWEEKWRKQVERMTIASSKEAKKELASLRTDEAKQAIQEVEDILTSSLSVYHPIDWDSIHDKSSYPESKPIIPEKPTPRPPPTESQFLPKLNLLDRLFASRARTKAQKSKEIYHRAFDRWKDETRSLKENFHEQVKLYNRHAEEWNERAKAFRSTQKQRNAELDELKVAYDTGKPTAVTAYCQLVLSASQYPESFPRTFDLDFIGETKVLIVSLSLPVVENLPSLKEVKFVATKDELVETFLPESALHRLYDETIYKIALRTIHELYDADLRNAIDSIIFNGFVDSIDKSTGHEVHACILSLQATREEFEKIKLDQVDAKSCVRKLKGVGSSQLHSLTPITPIMVINREDSRFVASYEVAGQLDDSFNLAAMDWEDFEHLIRELFEEEFRASGGEVKVTQASRDGGVDAVAFDPDPIRGGKIVIQAKRYTNVVGVAAVRDLYGTVVNEGATKGILVTTSQYGPDAYAFARDKPLTLMDGSNLLHLLQKHGHKAKIDLKEAKRVLNENRQLLS